MSDLILTVTCPARRGIVAAISGFLAANGCNITDSAQFDDDLTGKFFARISFRAETGTSLPALRKHLSAAELAPVYLVAGAEHLLVIEAADALRARARELGYVERDVLDAEANFDWRRLGDAGQSLSLFASRKLIDLRLPSGRPGKDGAEALAAYCAAPPPDWSRSP